MKNLCILPWTHLYINTQGKTQACCISNITYGNINTQSISEIWNGNEIKEIRKKFQNGNIDKRCQICFDKEASGKKSIRQESNEKYKSHFSKTKEITVSEPPIYWDIRFSNVCNLKCRTCWHGASSKWFEDAKILKNNASDKAIIKTINNKIEFFSELEKYLPIAEEFYYAGGEPLLMEEHYELLEKLIEHDSKSILLRYNTNLTELTFKHWNVIDLRNQFENVQISVSIDALGDKGEYIRRGLNFQKLVSNMKLIKEKCPHIKLEIAPTVSSMNIHLLFEMHQYFVNENLITTDGVYFNLLERPKFYNVKSLSKAEKRNITSIFYKYKEWLVSEKCSLKNEIDGLTKYMNSENWAGLKEKRQLWDSKLDELDK